MRRIFVAVLALIMSESAAIADDIGPITYHVPGVTVVVQQRTKSIAMRKDSDVTWLRESFTYDCLAASCLVIATAEAKTPGPYGPVDDLCVYADGKPMKPTCDISGTGIEIHNLQEQLIPQGTHSFQTGIRNEGSKKVIVCPCIVTYSIYDSGN